MIVSLNSKNKMSNNKLTTAQLIFRKHNEVNGRWIDFIEWIEASKQELLEHNQKEIELAHFYGKVNPSQGSTDYYRKTYESWLDGINVVRACINQKWYSRLYYNGEMIGNFISFDEAMNYALSNYDRATNTIKAN